jgi:cobaltochelatase CobS
MSNNSQIGLPSTDPSTWKAKFKIGDTVKIRPDYTVDMGDGASLVEYNSAQNSFTITSVRQEPAVKRNENPTGTLYSLNNGQSWEGKDLESATPSAAVPISTSQSSAPMPTQNAQQLESEEDKLARLQAALGRVENDTVKAMIENSIQVQKAKVEQAPAQVVAAALSQFATILNKSLATQQTSGGGIANQGEVETMIKEELIKAKFGFENLDDTLKKILENQKVQATLTIFSGSNQYTANVTISKEFLMRPLTQLILSDFVALNCVYLYGGAGTGKTFIAGEIAQLLGYKKIEINCSQFTSELEIKGGQTITGYQQGKLIEAWSNYMDGQDFSGAVLLLDELPKIDPNTAGLFNSALAKIKESGERSLISDGKGKNWEKKNILIIGTGNTKLNETSDEYEANFKQDLSLQDRFAGSTYQIFVYYETEVTTVMRGFLFIWDYLVRLREKIIDMRQTSRAFVSIRLMMAVRDTYRVFRAYDTMSPISAATGEPLISSPKSINQAMESFFSLFPDNISQQLKEDTKYDDFLKIVEEKNNVPFVDANNMDFDTPKEVSDCLAIAKKRDAEINKIYIK